MGAWIRRNWLLVLFVLVNAAMATPAAAGLDNDFCQDGDGGIVQCCTGCLFFCNCTLTE